MTELQKCMQLLEEKGYTDEYEVREGNLHCLTNDQVYTKKDVTAANFYRFEGESNPDDMSILYAIETHDGRKGTLVDAYGAYADARIGEFMKGVEIHKSVHDEKMY
ncbi:MAG: hypothetical protein INR73_23785 [Williamsia sp.]|nr:hypothetical protein [Williamsia sp.]